MPEPVAQAAVRRSIAQSGPDTVLPEGATFDLRKGGITDVYGGTGLKQFRGILYEEFLPQLATSQERIKVFTEMANQDGIVGSGLRAMYLMCGQTKWEWQPSRHPKADKDKAEKAQQFISECWSDMETPWKTQLYTILTHLRYGWDVHETLFKWRHGYHPDDPTENSKFNDGKIGWRDFSPRSQETLYRWEYDANGRLIGMWQIVPPTYQMLFVPMNRSLHFTTEPNKNNPEGTSILRTAYRAWWFKRNIETIEAVGIERDLAGLPVVWLPPELLDPHASDAMKAQLASFKRLALNLKRDDQEGVLFPLIYDEQGKNKLYDLTLLSTMGHRQFDTSGTIRRYQMEMLMSMLADFMILGHENASGMSQSTDKANLFGVALSTFLDNICDVITDGGEKLCRLNAIEAENFPYLIHGNVENIDLDKLGKYILQLAQAGAPVFPNSPLEDWLLDQAGLPPLDADERQEVIDSQRSMEEQLVTGPTDTQAANNAATGSAAQVAATRRAAKAAPGTAQAPDPRRPSQRANRSAVADPSNPGRQTTNTTQSPAQRTRSPRPKVRP